MRQVCDVRRDERTERRAVAGSWLAALEFHAGGNYELVQSLYSPQLQRHIDTVSLRPARSDNGRAPETFPEKIQAKISCYPVAQNEYADEHGQCAFAIQCDNVMDRKTKAVGDTILNMDIPPGGARVLCTAPPDLGANFESGIEDEYGVQLLNQLQATLRQVLTTGTLRPAGQPQFDTTPFYNVAFV